MSKKIVTFFLCFSIVFSSLCNTAMAARPSGGELITDTPSVTAWNTWLNSNMYVLPEALVGTSAFWNEFDHAIQASGAGACNRMDSLLSARDNWNGSFSVIDSVLFRLFSFLFTGSSARPIAEIAYDSTLGVDRLREVHTKLWIVNSSGHFPYYKPFSGSGSGFTEGVGKWVAYDQALGSNTALWHTVIGADLSAYAESWPDRRAWIKEEEDYFILMWNDPNQHNKAHVLCDDYGYPYYVPKPKQTAVTTPNNYYTELGDTYTDNSVTDNSTNVNVYDKGTAILDSILDVENGILNVGGEAYYVDEINYDASTKTYSVDSHDAYLWNSTTNNYVTNNYKWEVKFNINYTSVTYIGQTEEYDERYEYYYELPDGRSSADLTAEDLEQLSTVFYDVMNYSRASDDSALRALYHFDGNTDDSSYWSYTRQGFEWNKGASLTYMDEGTFGGSLYLDETEHAFEITLPGNDAGKDWTLQFRYYQSHTLSPVKDSYLSVGGDPLLYFTGSQYLDKNGNLIADTSVGTWNEICLMRSVEFGGGAYLSYYVNGVYCGRVSDPIHSQTIRFHFGSQQQTYKKLDELRFTKRAIYTPEVNYTPTVVPFDTNLSLILPGATDAIADEYIELTPSSSNMLSHFNNGDWSDANFTNKFIDGFPWVYGCTDRADHFFNGNKSMRIYYSSSYTGVNQGELGSLVSSSVTSPIVSLGNDLYGVGNGFFMPVFVHYTRTASSTTYHWYNCYLNADTDYSLTVVLADGSYSNIVFSHGPYVSNQKLYPSLSVKSTTINSVIKFSVNTIGGPHKSLDPYGSPNPFNEMMAEGISIYLDPGVTAEIIYAELVVGSSPQVKVEHKTVLYDPRELPDDFILAVKSNRPITTYQIGGVRPSYAEAGQVYAVVENNRIVSLQQYTGYVWEAVDGRIWTGSRWIPYSSFDVKTFQDLYDLIGTTDDYEYIYSESGFWSWFQKQWNAFMVKLDQIISLLSSSVGLPEKVECEHVYRTEETSPNCATPGTKTYTCENCGDVFQESVPALGHDWLVIEDVPSEFEMPEDAHCPDCDGEDFTYELNSSQDEFTCTCTVCGKEWKETPIITWGYTVSECSRCGVTQTESKDPDDNGLFSALGNFLSDGIGWILDKLEELVESVSGIQDTFKDFANRMKENVGAYPAFLAAAIAVIPGDLMDVIWFAVVALVAVLVYKKVTR